jgi:crotonobetainyl-CoA:carnitine CoA-transferase CaiB-like acyl-CoA transferase
MAERMLRAWGLEHMLADARFATNEVRVRHAAEVDRAVTNAIGARTLADNLAIIRDHDLTAVPVQTVADIEHDPHWIARGLLVDVPSPGGYVRMHDVVPRLSSTPGRIDHAGGALGQDTDAFLSEELGLSGVDIDGLRSRGTI